jgi:exodeoxyribonuclease-3
LKRLVSWNVNGIRACVNKGFDKWLKKELPDVICLQEIKAKEDQVPDSIKEMENIYDMTFYPAQKPGYSGVATLVKKELNSKSTKGIGIEQFDNEGRTIITSINDTLLINGYYPNGQRDHSRVDFKLDFSDAMLDEALKREGDFKNIILTGDFNTAHYPIDLANPKSNTKTTGFLPREREWMDKFVESGYVDTYRHLNPELEGGYTWWTYRNNCRERNIGWRIDYFFMNQAAIKNMKGADILSDVMGSDHCPISLDLKTL